METYPEDPFEMAKTRIISDDERQVMGILGGAVWGHGGHRIDVFG